MKLRSAILTLLLSQLSAAIAFSHAADEYIAFEQVCMDLLELTPEYRTQIKHHKYPDDPTGHRFIYCLGIITGNFYPEFKYQRLNADHLFNYYGKDQSPEQFRQRCELCELRAKEATEDRFEQHFRMYKCFERQYLEIFKNQIPAKVTCEEMEEAERICMEMFDVSQATRKLFRRQRYPESDETKRHFYCTSLVAGLYSERDDLNLDRLSTFVSLEGESRDAFVDRSRKCFKRMAVYEPGISRHEKLFRAYQCYTEEYVPFMDC